MICSWVLIVFIGVLLGFFMWFMFLDSWCGFDVEFELIFIFCEEVE